MRCVVKDPATQLFNDITTVDTGGNCVAHEGCNPKLPKKLHGFIAGFSCKNFSMLNNDVATFKKLLTDPTPEQALVGWLVGCSRFG